MPLNVLLLSKQLITVQMYFIFISFSHAANEHHLITAAWWFNFGKFYEGYDDPSDGLAASGFREIR